MLTLGGVGLGSPVGCSVGWGQRAAAGSDIITLIYMRLFADWIRRGSTRRVAGAWSRRRSGKSGESGGIGEDRGGLGRVWGCRRCWSCSGGVKKTHGRKLFLEGGGGLRSSGGLLGGLDNYDIQS